MRTTLALLALVLAAALAAPSGAAEPGQDPDAILGVWKTEADGDRGFAHVRIERDGTHFRGVIVDLSQPLYPEDDQEGMAGKTKVDRGNPDPALRGRPILGLELMRGFEFAGDSEWTGGTIYDPVSGNTYKCRLRLAADGTLRVRGYIGISLLGRNSIWTRASGPASSGTSSTSDATRGAARPSWSSTTVTR